MKINTRKYLHHSHASHQDFREKRLVFQQSQESLVNQLKNPLQTPEEMLESDTTRTLRFSTVRTQDLQNNFAPNTNYVQNVDVNLLKVAQKSNDTLAQVLVNPTHDPYGVQKKLHESEARNEIERFDEKVSLHSNIADNVSTELNVLSSSTTSENGLSYKTHFANLYTEDGFTFPEIKDKWLSVKSGNNGIFKPNHANGTLGNVSYNEYLKDAGDQKISTEDLKRYIRNADDEILNIQNIKDGLHQTAFNSDHTPKANIPDVLLHRLPLLNKFKNFAYTAQMSNGVNMHDKTFLPSEQDAIQEISRVSFILDAGKVATNGAELSSDQETFLEKYEKILEYSLKIQKIKKRKALLQTIVTDPNSEAAKNAGVQWQKNKEELERKIVQKKDIIDVLKAQSPENEKKIRKLEQEIEELESDGDFYEEYNPEMSDLYPNSSGYLEIFEKKYEIDTNTGERKEKIEVKNATNAMGKLSKYYEWVQNRIFMEGVPRPTQKNVEAVLVASAYRGDFTASQLRVVLKKLSEKTDKSLIDFYEIVGKILQGGNVQELQTFFTSHSEISSFSPALLASAKNWNTKNLSGNTATGGKNDALALRGIDGSVAFEKKWGFKLSLAFYSWKNQANKNLNSGEKDLLDAVKTRRNALPLSSWINENGNVNNSAEMKDFLSDIIPAHSHEDWSGLDAETKALYKKIENKSWNGNEPELKNFISMLKDGFTAELNSEDRIGRTNSAQSTYDYIQKVKNTAGTSIGETFEYMLDEAADLNPMYLGIGGLILYLSSKSSWFKNIALTGTTIGIVNAVVEDIKGFDIIDEAWDYVVGEDNIDKNNSATIAMEEMRQKQLLENKDFSEKELERAGTALGEANFKEMLEWYKECTALSTEGVGNKRTLNKVYNNSKLPSGFIKNSSIIFHNKGSQNMKGDMEENKAKAAFQFFEAYLKNTSLKQDSNENSGLGDAEKGYAYLADTYYENCTIEGGNQTYDEDGKTKTGFRFEQIMWFEKEQEVFNKMVESKSEIFRDVEEFGVNTYDFIMTHYKDSFESPENAVQKLKEMKASVLSWGWKIGEATKNELVFFDKTGQAWKILKDKTTNAWKFVSESESVEKVFNTMNEAWEGLQKHATAGFTAVTTAAVYLNQVSAGANTNVVKNNVEVFQNRNINLEKSVEDLGIAPAIMKTYGIENKAMLQKFLTNAMQNLQVQAELKEIAKVKKENATTVTNADVFIYFFGKFGYGAGALAQGLANIVEGVSGLANHGVQEVAGVVSDDAKAFLQEYDPSKLARISVRDNIDGKEHFRKVIEKESKDSIETGTDIIFTKETLIDYAEEYLDLKFTTQAIRYNPTFLESFYDANIVPFMNDLIVEWGGSGSIDTTQPSFSKENVSTYVINELSRKFQSETFRKGFIAEALQSQGNITKIYLETAIKAEIKKILKDYQYQ